MNLMTISWAVNQPLSDKPVEQEHAPLDLRRARGRSFNPLVGLAVLAAAASRGRFVWRCVGWIQVLERQ